MCHPVALVASTHLCISIVYAVYALGGRLGWFFNLWLGIIRQSWTSVYCDFVCDRCCASGQLLGIGARKLLNSPINVGDVVELRNISPHNSNHKLRLINCWQVVECLVFLTQLHRISIYLWVGSEGVSVECWYIMNFVEDCQCGWQNGHASELHSYQVLQGCGASVGGQWNLVCIDLTLACQSTGDYMSYTHLAASIAHY